MILALGVQRADSFLWKIKNVSYGKGTHFYPVLAFRVNGLKWGPLYWELR